MLEIVNVRKRYPPSTDALQGVSLTVARGEIVCLVGPSGCGKTTLLRIVAGLEQADSGRLLLEGADLTSVPVHERGFGLMFQEFALFPDKSVAQNVTFGLRMAGRPRAAIDARVNEMLALVGMQGYGDRSIFDLSGGERQRVALARSLAPSPRLLMLDEPLGSLDRALRESLMDELRVILKRLGLTALYVTHDQQEALAVADRVVVMNRGRFAQVGTPRELYLAPASAFVARFLGLVNLLPAEVRAQEPTLAHTALGSIPLAAPAPAGHYSLLLRPNALDLASAQPALSGTVVEVSFRGQFLRVEIEADSANGKSAGTRLVFEAPLDTPISEGRPLRFGVEPALVTLLPAAE